MGTPSAVSKALLQEPTVIGDIVLQPLTLGLYLFLEKIDSPLIKEGANKVSTLDLFRAVYVLATPLPDCLALWANGTETFDAAVLGFSDRIPLSEMDKLGEKILNHVKSAFEPVAKTTPPDDNTSPLADSPPPAAG